MRIHIGGYVLILTVMASVVLQQPELVIGQARVPAMFVLGDSLVDVGNSNFLASVAQADYLPYGIDFDFTPTGRFTNGKNFIDLLAELVGLQSPPAFADPTTTGTILGGVNYASAAAGILDESGQNYGDRYSLSFQVRNLGRTLSQLKTMMSPKAYTAYLAKSLVVLAFGSSDYVSNYLMPDLYSSSQKYNASEFANFLLAQYAQQLHALYNLGLRKVFITGLLPLGCTPDQRASGIARPGSCVNSVNEMLGPFNQGLKSLVDQINKQSPEATFVYGNIYEAFGDILNNSTQYGFNTVDSACCGTMKKQEYITCFPFQDPCANRSEYVFWDAFHPTQTAISVLVRRVFYGPPSDAYPVNIQQMTQLY